jgi:hypothetical protein
MPSQFKRVGLARAHDRLQVLIAFKILEQGLHLERLRALVFELALKQDVLDSFVFQLALLFVMLEPQQLSRLRKTFLREVLKLPTASIQCYKCFPRLLTYNCTMSLGSMASSLQTKRASVVNSVLLPTLNTRSTHQEGSGLLCLVE